MNTQGDETISPKEMVSNTKILYKIASDTVNDACDKS